MENQTINKAVIAACEAERAALIEVASAAEFQARFAYLLEQEATSDLVALADRAVCGSLFASAVTEKQIDHAEDIASIPCFVVRVSDDLPTEAEAVALARAISDAFQGGAGFVSKRPREWRKGQAFEPARVMLTFEDEAEIILRKSVPELGFYDVSAVFIELATARAIAAHFRKDAPLAPEAAEADPYRGYKFGDLLTDSVSGLTGKVIARSETAEGAFCLRLQPRALGASIPRAVWFPVDRLGRYVPRDRALGHRLTRPGAPSEVRA